MPLVLDGNGDITGLVAGALPSTVIGAGGVLQVVNATFGTSATTSSTSYVDTGLSASITPTSSSSKILIFANIPDVFNNGGNTTIAFFNLVRGSTQIIEFVKHGNYINLINNLITYGGSTLYLDSPATTSAITYGNQYKADTSGVSLILGESSGLKSIILLEIGA